MKPRRIERITGVLATLAVACSGPPSTHQTTTPDESWDPPEGTLGTPIHLVSGSAVEGDTSEHESHIGSRCGAGATGPEVVYGFTLAQHSRVMLELRTQSHDGSLSVWSSSGREIAEVACNEDAPDETRSLVLAHLPPGEYIVAADGAGVHQKGPFTLELTLAPLEGEATEPSVIDPTPGWTTLSGSTFSSADTIETPCSSSPGGPDSQWTLSVQTPTLISASVLSSDFSAPILALGQEQTSAWTSCGIGNIAGSVEPGTHLLAIDGLGADQWGSYEIEVRTQQLSALSSRCEAAPTLIHNGSTSGSSSGADDFRAGCGTGSRGPESIRSLTLTQPARVTLALNSMDFDGVLHIRSECTDPGSEKGCNDDQDGQSSAELELELEKGTWWVFIDGRNPFDEGTWTLQVAIEPLDQT